MCTCMIETSSVLLGYLQKSLAILGNFQKKLEAIVWPLDIFWRIFTNRQKVFENLHKNIQKVVISIFV